MRVAGGEIRFMVLGVLLVYLPEHHTRNRQLATLELTRGNCKSQFLRFQGEFTPKVEISGRGVLVLYSTSWIAFYNCSAQNPGWCDGMAGKLLQSVATSAREGAYGSSKGRTQNLFCAFPRIPQELRDQNTRFEPRKKDT